MKARIVFLASAWGPRHGGINSFNADLVIATAQSILDRTIECVCITAETPSNQELSQAKNCGVEIITHPVHDPEQWTRADAESIHAELFRRSSRKVTWWVGHDVITGEAAVALAQRVGGRSAVIHHMSYVDYAGYKNSGSSALHAKRQRQHRVFNATDTLLAVGPLLQKRLAEMLGTLAQRVTALVPGLAEVPIPPERSSAVNAIVFGRLDDANERIKQGRLAISAFGLAMRQARKDASPTALIESPAITMIGVGKAEEEELKRFATSKAGAVVNLITLPFMEDRALLWRALTQSNVALVASWHEGFGLAAWEAIAAQVPLVVGRNTGVYQLLRTELSGAEIGFVRGVDVRGALDRRRGGHFRAEDEKELRDAILYMAENLTGAQERARLLRTLLAHYTWSRTAEQFVSALNLGSYTKRLVEVSLPGKDGGHLSSIVPFSYKTSMYESVEAASLLLSEARLAYGRRSYGDVHAISIRAAEAFERGGYHTEAVSALIEAVSALRPGRRGTELRQIIMKVYQICAEHSIAPAVRWLFLDRFALVLFDYAKFSKAAQVVAASQELFQRVSPDADNPQRLVLDSANSLRRRAVIKGSAGKLEFGSQVQRVLDELIDGAKQFSNDRQFNSFATNLDVASKLSAEVLGNIELAHSYSEQALGRRGDINHWWVLQEHLWREAEYYKARGDTGLAIEMVVEALKIQERSPVLLEPVAGKPEEPRSDLRKMINRLGIDLLELSERGVKVNQLKGTPLRLRDDTIDLIVRTVMA